MQTEGLKTAGSGIFTVDNLDGILLVASYTDFTITASICINRLTHSVESDFAGNLKPSDSFSMAEYHREIRDKIFTITVNDAHLSSPLSTTALIDIGVNDAIRLSAVR